MVGVASRPFGGLLGCLGTLWQRLGVLGRACPRVLRDRPTGLYWASLLLPLCVDEDFFRTARSDSDAGLARAGARRGAEAVLPTGRDDSRGREDGVGCFFGAARYAAVAFGVELARAAATETWHARRPPSTSASIAQLT